MLTALIKLVNSSKWISEATWLKMVSVLDKESLLWLKNQGLWQMKYFTREDWLGSESRDRILQAVNERLEEYNVIDLIRELF